MKTQTTRCDCDHGYFQSDIYIILNCTVAVSRRDDSMQETEEMQKFKRM